MPFEPPAVRPTYLRDYRIPAVATEADIPAWLDWLRVQPEYKGGRVVGVLVQTRDTGALYRVTAQPALGTPGTLADYGLDRTPSGASMQAAVDVLLDEAEGLAAVTLALQPALDEVGQATTEALAVAGVVPATTSQTTADPPAPPAGVTSGVKFDQYGNRVLLKWAGNIWIQTSRIIGADGLPYRDARYYGMAAGRNAAQNAQGLLDAQGDAKATGGVGIVQLPPLSLDIDQDMITSTFGGVELRGVRGQTVLRAALTSTSPLLQGSELTLRDVILDGVNRVTTGATSPGIFRMFGGAIRNIYGTSAASAYGLIQQPTSTIFTVHGVLFDTIDGYDDGITGNGIGAPRAMLLSGLFADLDDIVVRNLMGIRDADAIHFQTQPDADLVWTPAYATVGRVRVESPGKRGMKFQASNITVRELMVTHTDETDAGCLYAGVEMFGSDNVILRLIVDAPRAFYGAVNNGSRNKILSALIKVGVGKAYTTGRGSVLRGYSDTGQDSTFNGEVYTCNWGIHLGGTSRNARVTARHVQGRNPILVDGGATGNTVEVGVAEGRSTDLAWMDAAARLASGAMNNIVRIGEARYGVNGGAITGTADGNTLIIDRYTSIGTPLNTFNLTAGNNLFAGTNALSAKASTISSPSVRMPPSSGQLNPYLIGLDSDALEACTLNLAIPPVVSLTNGGTGAVTNFTAGILIGQTAANNVLSLPFSTYGYPFVAKVDFGTGSLYQSYSTVYVPVALFQSLPVGLTGWKLEIYNGSTWTTLFDLAVTPSLYLEGPPVVIPTGTKMVQETFSGATPGSGSFNPRRIGLLYPELAPTQNRHPSWAVMRAAHNWDGKHPTATATVDPPPIAAGGVYTFTMGLSGAALNMSVHVNPPGSLGGLTKTEWVSGPSQVTVELRNPTTSAIDLAAGTWTGALTK